MMNDPEESDPAVVAMNLANKVGVAEHVGVRFPILDQP
jgi:hypothetical protein